MSSRLFRLVPALGAEIRGVDLAPTHRRRGAGASLRRWSFDRISGFSRIRSKTTGATYTPEGQQRSVPNREIDGMLHDERQIFTKTRRKDRFASTPKH